MDKSLDKKWTKLKAIYTKFNEKSYIYKIIIYVNHIQNIIIKKFIN